MASCSTSAIAPHAPLLRFRINVTGGDSVRAKIDYLDPDIEGLMAFSLFVGVIAFSLLYTWLVIHRTRVMFMEDVLDDRGLDEALVARRAEAAARQGEG